MKELSVFVDESGDFGKYSKHSPYYIVSMIFHCQENNISKQVMHLNHELAMLGLHNHVVHTEPLIRKEEDYVDISPNIRRSIFTKLFYFAMNCEFQYKSFIFRKNEYDNSLALQKRIERDISIFIRDHLSTFQSYDHIILYYDNGQHELSQILKSVFSKELSQYDIRKVFPIDYKLFQVADLICTLTLLELKCLSHHLSRSEILIFHSERALKKDFLKPIKGKEWQMLS